MWEAYWIGLAAGVGVGAGVVLAGALGWSKIGRVAAIVVAVAIGASIGFAIGRWEILAGALGGAAGAFGAVQLVQGTLKRGGTRGGTATLVGVAGLALAALALVPVVGYLTAVAVPVLGARLRRGGDTRYAGLRILAKD